MKPYFKSAVLLGVGFAVGATLMTLRPAQNVKAASAANNSKFSMATVPVSIPNETEAVFVLDHLTGTLRGGVLSQQSGKFTFTYLRSVAGDFAVNPATPEPKYAIVAGPMNASGIGGSQTAKGVLYVGELSSGAVIAYAFAQPRGRGAAVPLELVPLDRLNFRESIGG